MAYTAAKAEWYDGNEWEGYSSKLRAAHGNDSHRWCWFRACRNHIPTRQRFPLSSAAFSFVLLAVCLALPQLLLRLSLDASSVRAFTKGPSFPSRFPYAPVDHRMHRAIMHALDSYATTNETTIAIAGRNATQLLLYNSCCYLHFTFAQDIGGKVHASTISCTLFRQLLFSSSALCVHIMPLPVARFYFMMSEVSKYVQGFWCLPGSDIMFVNNVGHLNSDFALWAFF